MNVFSGIGNVGRDAETRYTQAGKPVTSFSVAIESGFGDHKQTTWLDCGLWGDRGVKISEFIRKGDPVGVTGELGTREYEGKTYVTLNVRDVKLIRTRAEREGGAAPGSGRNSAPARPASKPAPDRTQADGFEDDDIPF